MRNDLLLHTRASNDAGFAVEPIIDDALLPTGARCVELHVGASDLSRYVMLPDEEQELVERAVTKRKADFGDSRWCAHQALEAINADGIILRGQRGMPLFPAGTTGSLTHTEGYRAAIVGRSSRWQSLGIDAEPATHLPDGVFEAIARPEERRRLHRLAQHHGIPVLDKILFSAKETTYKAWFPLTKRFLDFDEADIDIRPDGSFTAYLLTRPVPVPFIQGRWIVKDGFVVTLAGVRA